MSVGGDDVKCMVLKSADTYPLIAPQALVKKMDGNPNALIDLFTGNLLNSSVASHFRDTLRLSEDPLVLYDETKRRELVNLYDLILRELARDTGIVIYRGKVGNQIMTKCNLDLPIFPTP